MPLRAPGSLRSLLLGIMAVAFSPIFGLGLGCALIAIVLLIRARSFAKAEPEHYVFGPTAWTATAVVVVGTALSVLFTMFYMAFFAFLLALIAAFTGSGGHGPLI
jgi:hypothetical protein